MTPLLSLVLSNSKDRGASLRSSPPELYPFNITLHYRSSLFVILLSGKSLTIKGLVGRIVITFANRPQGSYVRDRWRRYSLSNSLTLLFLMYHSWPIKGVELVGHSVGLGRGRRSILSILNPLTSLSRVQRVDHLTITSKRLGFRHVYLVEVPTSPSLSVFIDVTKRKFHTYYSWSTKHA